MCIIKTDDPVLLFYYRRFPKKSSLELKKEYILYIHRYSNLDIYSNSSRWVIITCLTYIKLASKDISVWASFPYWSIRRLSGFHVRPSRAQHGMKVFMWSHGILALFGIFLYETQIWFLQYIDMTCSKLLHSL